MLEIRHIDDYWRRLRLLWIIWYVALSTFTMDVDADHQNDMTPITGQGWKSAVRVRMLHATVRTRIAAKKGMKNVYDHKVDGIPINQE